MATINPEIIDHSLIKIGWEIDFYSTAGRKIQNQDSLLMTSCLLDYLVNPQHKSSKTSTALSMTATQVPMLAVLADGVSACQFPKQASKKAIEEATKYIIEGLTDLNHQLIDKKNTESDWVSFSSFEDESVARIIKSAVSKANDSMYFSQSYQRTAPLLSTLSGVLCLGDKVHLFHTGDSRIYRFSADTSIVLSTDHRQQQGQDQGALSAALGADAQIELQQMVFTLHQNEYLALMTDGVYDHLNPVELQFELNAVAKRLMTSTSQESLANLQISQRLCQQAYEEGSNDNLSLIIIGMSHHSKIKACTKIGDKPHSSPKHAIDNLPHGYIDNPEPQAVSVQYKLAVGLKINQMIDGFTVKSIIARTSRSEVYLVQDETGQEYVLKSPSLRSVDDGEYLRCFLKERKIGLSLSKHRRAGESAYNQADPNLINSDQNHQSPLRFGHFNNPQEPSNHLALKVATSKVGSALGESGLLRYYPVPASSTYLYHLTEYVEGESLRMFMDRNGHCDAWQTHDLLTKIGMAVRVMHRNYLLHQDIKPENILLTKSGAVKLIDFGSAASIIVKDNTRPPNGDLHYAAPEYYTEAPKGVHSEIFSIAVIGFELLTGSRPFSPQMLMSASIPLIVPSNLLHQKKVPITCQHALLRALHRQGRVRHQAIGEFLQDFNPDNNAVLAELEPLIKRNPLLVWHGICLIQGIVIVFLLIKFLPTL